MRSPRLQKIVHMKYLVHIIDHTGICVRVCTAVYVVTRTSKYLAQTTYADFSIHVLLLFRGVRCVTYDAYVLVS